MLPSRRVATFTSTVETGVVSVSESFVGVASPGTLARTVDATDGAAGFDGSTSTRTIGALPPDGMPAWPQVKVVSSFVHVQPAPSTEITFRPAGYGSLVRVTRPLCWSPWLRIAIA